MMTMRSGVPEFVMRFPGMAVVMATMISASAASADSADFARGRTIEVDNSIVQRVTELLDAFPLYPELDIDLLRKAAGAETAAT